MKISYCKVCGRTPAYMDNNGDKKCLFCGTQNSEIESKYDSSYYDKKSIERCGSTVHDLTILREEEVFLNPEFNRELFNKLQEKNSEVFRDPSTYEHVHEYLRTQSHLPTCPTCHSTNVKKISFAKGYLHWRAFGLFSKTARSQYHCQNCDYKW